MSPSTAQSVYQQQQQNYSQPWRTGSKQLPHSAYSPASPAGPPYNYSSVAQQSNYNSNTNLRGRGSGNNLNCGRGIGRSSSSMSVPSVTCQICCRIGHSAAHCYYRFEKSPPPPCAPRQPPSLQAYQAAHSQPPAYGQPQHPSYFSHPSPSLPSAQEWVPDTGATHHMTNDFRNLNLQVAPYEGTDRINIGDGTGLHISHVGSSRVNSNAYSYLLSNILVSPPLRTNLLSVQRFASDNAVYFE